MPSLPCSVAAAGALLLAAGAAAKPAASTQFPIRTGRVTYTMMSPFMSGTRILSWTENGKRFREEMTGTGGTPGQQRKVKSWTIGDGTYLYALQDAQAGQVMRMKLPKGGPHGASGATPFGIGNQGKVVGKASILGKPCEIRDMGGAKAWVWQGLPLKMVAQQGPQSMTLTATKIETPSSLPASLFKVPAGMKITDFHPQAGRGTGAAPR